VTRELAVNPNGTGAVMGDLVEQGPAAFDEGGIEEVADDLGKREADEGADDECGGGEDKGPAIGPDAGPQPGESAGGGKPSCCQGDHWEKDSRMGGGGKRKPRHWAGLRALDHGVSRYGRSS